MTSDAGQQIEESDPRTPFAVLIIAFVGANALIVPAATATRRGGAVFVFLAASVLGSQLSLVAAWGVFGSAPFWVRLGRCAALGFGSFFSLMFGVALIGGQPTSFTDVVLAVKMMLVFLSCMPLVFFCVQLPLWALRVWLGWEMTKPEASAIGSYARPVMIKDLLLATVVVSVALALIRLAPTFAPPGMGMQPAEFYVFTAILAAVAMGASLITLPPLVYAILGLGQPMTCAVGAATWTGVMCVICWTPVFLSANAAPRLELLIALTFMNLVFVGLVSLGLLLVRNQGYRLRWRSMRPMNNLDERL